MAVVSGCSFGSAANRDAGQCGLVAWEAGVTLADVHGPCSCRGGVGWWAALAGRT